MYTYSCFASGSGDSLRRKVLYADVRSLQREECVCHTKHYLTYKTYLYMWAVCY